MEAILYYLRIESLLNRMGFVKRRGTTSKSKKVIEHFDEVRADFLEDVRTVAVMEEICP